MRYVALLLTLASACTAENPAYQPSDDGTLDRPDLGVEGGDLRGTAGCSQGERRCRRGALGWTSQFCHRGAWADDRRCPQDSGCAAGYCQRPPEQGFFE